MHSEYCVTVDIEVGFRGVERAFQAGDIKRKERGLTQNATYSPGVSEAQPQARVVLILITH